MNVNLSKITRDGKALFLAYDQGMEHGPTDFNDENVDPAKILKIAESGSFTGIILQKGVAEKYYDKKKNKVPLIVKLNGKTNLVKDEDPYSPQVCSIQEAIDLGACGVGYTIYLGSEFESFMMAEFGKIQEEAHKKGLPVIAWMYPRGRNIASELDPKIIAYAARVGLELGADIVKVRYTENVESFRWVVESAGKTKVVAMGGSKEAEKDFLIKAREIMEAGAIGFAVGRNIWQSKEPLLVSRSLSEIIWGEKNV
ncbi:fructose-bisphosphate aldolase [Patescibacteria group bacterium]|nr:fructose-bisphosphate aldolase [Patescibacteria group bacterium]